MLRFLSLFLGNLFLGAAVVDYSGYHLLRFQANETVATWLENLCDEHLHNAKGVREIDVWAQPSKSSPWADVLVSSNFLPKFRQLLHKEGITEKEVTVVTKNIQSEILREKKEIRKMRRKARSVDSFDIMKYHSYDEMVAYMRDLSISHPHLVQLLNVSKSFERRTIWGVKISRNASYKPAIFVDAGVHAREWIAAAAALHLIQKLVDGYGTDARITKSIDTFDWYIVPQVNPDGYEYSRKQDRLWRKTRSRNSTVNKWCVGADANRNWGYKWGEVGANRSPCSNIYAGSHPYSEPEIVGLREFITWQVPSITVYASLHAYGQLLLTPWGFTNQKPANYLDQRSAARTAINAMRAATNAEYSYGTISELMYPASGTSIDYMQAKGVPYIYGIELRPLDTIDGYGFSLPTQYIEPTGRELLAGLLAVGEYAIEHKKI